MKILQSGWMSALLGGVLFLGTTGFLLQPSKIAPHGITAREAGHSQSASHEARPSWEFVNPELDQLVNELKKEKAALEARAQQLSELETRLDTERSEITVLTHGLNKMRQAWDKNALKIREEETASLKKLAKTYAAMTPEGAAAIFRQMEDDEIAKLLTFIKDDEKAPLLEAFAKLGEPEAKRAAAITTRLPKATKAEAKP